MSTEPPAPAGHVLARKTPRAGAPSTMRSPSTMKAVVRDTYGSADRLAYRDVERPTPAAGEVLVRVRAAGLDRGAWHLMTGRPYLLRIAGFGVRRPRRPILGSELAGVVERAGADVTGLAPGDAVFGVGSGSFAEFVTARPGQLAPLPSNLTCEQAAALPVSGSTALQALRDRGHVQAGQHVLIIGASGGVGTFAVQIAKALGAEVTGVCSAAKTDLVRSIGADHVLDYTTGDLGVLGDLGDLGDAGRRYDLILDIAGNRPLAMLRRALTPKGTLVIVGGEGGGPWFGRLDRQLRAPLLSLFVGQRLGSFIGTTNRADLDTLRTFVENGSVTPVVDRVCSLPEIPTAMRDLESGRVRGKVVATV